MRYIRPSIACVAVLFIAGCGSRPEVSQSPVATPAAKKSAEKPRADRRVYKYSVLPGGVGSREELKQRLTNDSLASRHYAGVPMANLSLKRVTQPKLVYVSYRTHKGIFWTSKRVPLHPGEFVLASASGEEMVRGRCGNRISDVAMGPTQADEPSGEEMESWEPTQVASWTPREENSWTPNGAAPAWSPAAVSEDTPQFFSDGGTGTKEVAGLSGAPLFTGGNGGYGVIPYPVAPGKGPEDFLPPGQPGNPGGPSEPGTGGPGGPNGPGGPGGPNGPGGPENPGGPNGPGGPGEPGNPGGPGNPGNPGGPNGPGNPGGPSGPGDPGDVETPEPGTWLSLGTGMVLVGVGIWRRGR